MPVIGYATLPIVPSLAGAQSTIVSQLGGAGTQAGAAFGANFASKFAEAAKASAEVVAGALTGVVTAALAVGVSFNALEQRSRAALTTLLGGAEAASAQMDKLNAFVATSPFGKDTFIGAQQNLIGFGVEAKKVVPILDAIGDAIAATGGDDEGISDLAGVFADIQAGGQITSDALDSFASHGIDAAVLLGEQMGKTGAEIEAAISEGAIGADEAIDALTTGLNEKFDGASAGVKNTWDGVTQRISAQFRNLGSVLAEPFVSKAGGGMAVEWAVQIGDSLIALRQKIEPVYQELISAMAPLFERVSGFLDKVRTGIDRIDGSGFGELLAKVKDFGPALAGAAGGFAALSAGALSSLPVIGGLIPALGPIPAILGAIALTSPELRSALGGAFTAIMDALAPLVPLIGETVTMLAETFGPVIAKLVTGLTPLVQIVGPILQAAFTALNLVLQPVLWTVEKLADAAAFLLAPFEVVARLFGGTETAAEKAAAQIAEVNKAAGALVSGVGPLRGTLDTVTTEFTDMTNEAIKAKLAILDINDQKVEVTGNKSVLQEFQAIGVGASQLTAAALGDADAMAAATAKIKASQDSILEGKVAELGIAEQLAMAGIDVSTLNTTEGINAASQAWSDYAEAQQAALTDDTSFGQFDAGADLIAASAATVNDLFKQTPELLAESATMLAYLGKQTAAYSAEQRQLIQDQIEGNKIMGQFGDVEGRTQALLVQSGVMAENGDALVVTAQQYAALYAEEAKAGESATDFANRMSEFNMVSLDTPAAVAGAIQSILDVGNAGAIAAADLDSAKGAMQAFLDNAMQIRGQISSALTSFVNPSSAWETVRQAAQDAMKKANEPGKKAKAGDDPAVQAAKRAVDAGKKIKDAAIKAAKDQKEAATDAAKGIKKQVDEQAKAEVKMAKDAEEGAAKRLAIAKKEADKYQELADAKKKAAEDADSTLEDAEFRARAADAAVAAAQLAYDGADPTNRTQWELALNEALEEQKKARTDLGVAQDDQKAKTRESTTATREAETATKNAEQAEIDLGAAKENTATVTEDTSARQAAAAEALTLAQEAAADAFELAQEAATATYEGLVERKKIADEAARASAEASSQGVSDAVSTMTDNVKVSFSDYLTELQKQVDAQTEWKDNLLKLVGVLDDDVLTELAKAGPAMAPVVDQLVHDATAGQRDTFNEIFKKSTEAGVQGATDALTAGIPLLALAGATIGQSTADEIKGKLADVNNLADLKALGAEYGFQMQAGIDGAPPTFSFVGDFGTVNDDLRWWMDNLPPVTIPFVGNGGQTDGIVPLWDNAVHRAGGGPIRGPGSSTSDQIPVWASNGEEMWAAAEVAGAGGHGVVGALRSAARSGTLGEALGGKQTIIQVAAPQIYNPVAEPESVSTNRYLAFAATLDELS